MRKHIITSWFTILCIKSVVNAVALSLTPREFNAKGWNTIYCQPRCKITTCHLLCPVETADRWADCMFLEPYPGVFACIGMKINKQ